MSSFRVAKIVPSKELGNAHLDVLIMLSERLLLSGQDAKVVRDVRDRI